MEKKFAFITLLSLAMTLASCGGNTSSSQSSSVQSSGLSAVPSNPSSEPSSIPSLDPSSEPSLSSETINKFTVIWKNYDGSILETDEEVEEGSTPVYDGPAPTKPDGEGVKYVFSGWTPSIQPVLSDITYTATFSERHEGDVPGVVPTISEDGKTVRYGFYPTNHVGDETLIASLEENAYQMSNSWYVYEGNYYAKETSKLYNSENYSFDDKTKIEDATEYWFTVEPIEWKVAKSEGGRYNLVAKNLVDAHNFYKNCETRVASSSITHPNNYKESDIRSWLNSYFLGLAFGMSDDYLIDFDVDNSAASTDSNINKYVCENTNDKVYLPSYADMVNDSSKTSKTTDYARSRGAWSNNKDASLTNNGSYWTRSPSSEFSYCAWNVNAGGYLSQYAVDGSSHSVKPCITIAM